ncbi:hypothetical protein EG329_006924 [Mollisiaceae sp. DMI_Dod_QoI]|nr:hypothetical protein EG329_006924 [Helotiales sp. DMI_Dod_QoI]
MAVLTDKGNNYHVRVQRVPQGTYFKEYVKIGDPEGPNDKERDRYIVAEREQKYRIEVNLGKGFRWGEYNEVHCHLKFAGYVVASKALFRDKQGQELKEKEVTMYLECVMTGSNENIIGAPFTFRGLGVDENLKDETNIFELRLQDLGAIRVIISRCKKLGLKKAVKPSFATPQNLWEVDKVDPQSYKKHGITCTIGLGTTRMATRGLEPTRCDYTHDRSLAFKFNYRTAVEFLENLSIVPYPPPQYCYSWEKLQPVERKTAFEELQRINKGEFRARSGLTPRDGYEHDDGPVQTSRIESQRHVERATSRQMIGAGARNKCIVMKEESIEQTVARNQDTSTRKRSYSTSIAATATPVQRSRIQTAPGSVKVEALIKQEPIDVDALADSDAEMISAPTIKYDLTTEELPGPKRVKIEDDSFVSRFDELDTAEDEEYPEVEVREKIPSPEEERMRAERAREQDENLAEFEKEWREYRRRNMPPDGF